MKFFKKNGGFCLAVFSAILISCLSTGPEEKKDSGNPDETGKTAIVVKKILVQLDTTILYDTTFVFDTTSQLDSVFVYDTLVVLDSVFKFDTTYHKDSVYHYDSVYSSDTVYVFDTMHVLDSVWYYDSLFMKDTVFRFDTTHSFDTIHFMDTTVHLDTVVNLDTVYNFDTLVFKDTLIFYDTAFIYDTVRYVDTSFTSDTLFQSGLGSMSGTLLLEGASDHSEAYVAIMPDNKFFQTVLLVPSTSGEYNVSGAPEGQYTIRLYYFKTSGIKELLKAYVDTTFTVDIRGGEHYDLGTITLQQDLQIGEMSVSSSLPKTAYLRWKTNFSSTARIEWGSTTAYGNDTLIAAEATEFMVTLNVDSGYTYFRVNSYTDADTAMADKETTVHSFKISSRTYALQPGGIDLNWTTNFSSTCKVEWGATTSYGMDSSFTKEATSFGLNLSKLADGTQYFKISSYGYGDTLTDTFSVVIEPFNINETAIRSLASDTAYISWSADDTVLAKIEWGSTSAYGSDSVFSNDTTEFDLQMSVDSTADLYFKISIYDAQDTVVKTYQAQMSTGTISRLLITNFEYYYERDKESLINIIDSISTAQGFSYDIAYSSGELESYLSSNRYDAIVLNNLTGSMYMDTSAQSAIVTFVRNGGGLAATYGCAERPWFWLQKRILINSTGFTELTEATVSIDTEGTDHEVNQGLPSSFAWLEGWMTADSSPRGRINTTILLTVDEKTYECGKACMGSDHPVSWVREQNPINGRIFFTGIGSQKEVYNYQWVREHLWNGINWSGTGRAYQLIEN